MTSKKENLPFFNATKLLNAYKKERLIISEMKMYMYI